MAMEGGFVCEKCNRQFSRVGSLRRHLNKKIPCDIKHICPKCGHEFMQKSDLKKHLNRKTPCEPIQGDPTKPIDKNTCRYCYSKFKHKSSLVRHYKTCKIKNGNMDILFQKIEEKNKKLEKENKKLQKRLKKANKERDYMKLFKCLGLQSQDD